MTDIISDLLGVVSGSTAWIHALIQTNGYLALAVLMSFEGASLPIPSEVVIPLAGYYAAKGLLNLQLAFLVILLGNTIGLAIDYSIGYFIGKEVVYKHLKGFKLISAKRLKNFDAWFERNGVLAVFISRMLPEVRALISFPAGFAKMPLPKFFIWSIAGSAIWDFILILFGYYALGATQGYILASLIGVFALAVYIVYRLGVRMISKNNATTKKQ
jgi:membrane protein DedA with SNARE-associated domain